MKKSEYKEIAAKFGKLAEDTGRLREHGIESISMHLADAHDVLPNKSLHIADRITVRVVQVRTVSPYNVGFVWELLLEAGVDRSALRDLSHQGTLRRFRIDIPFDDPGVEVRRACGCIVFIKPYRDNEATKRRIAKLESTECFACKWDLDRRYAEDMRRHNLPYFKGSRIVFVPAFNIRGKHYRAMLSHSGALLVRASKEFAALASSGQISVEDAVASVARRQKELEDVVAYITRERFTEVSAKCWIDAQDDPPTDWEAEFNRVLGQL